MKNFKDHKLEIIENFCNRFKSDSWKSIWGINLLCNSKTQEEVWLELKLLNLQEISECPNSCNQTNPTFTILVYGSASNTNQIFPQLSPNAHC